MLIPIVERKYKTNQARQFSLLYDPNRRFVILFRLHIETYISQWDACQSTLWLSHMLSYIRKPVLLVSYLRTTTLLQWKTSSQYTTVRKEYFQNK